MRPTLQMEVVEDESGKEDWSQVVGGSKYQAEEFRLY